MLESIKITNLALISKSSVQFKEGFNVLTGETGAGKSLIVDALLFLTGIRADKTLIKSGEEFARVEGVFSVDTNNHTLNDILSSVDIENEGTIIVSRYFSVSGKNECRLNGEIVTLNILRKVASCILDIFGQNDSQILLDSKNHLSLLDEIIGESLVDDKAKLSENLDKLHGINSQIKELGGLDKDRENNIKLIQFEIDEIDNANLYDGEEEELKSKLTVMQNSEKIYGSLNQSIEVLDGEYNVSNILKTAINTLSSIEQYDDNVSKEKDRIYSIKYELDDIVSDLNSMINNLSYSQEELDMLQDRLSDIKDLERKYGNTIADILAHKLELEDRLDVLLNADEKLLELKSEKNRILKEIFEICTSLRNIRKAEFGAFSERLVAELKKLGMKNASFALSFENDIDLDTIEKDVDENGADRIEFLFSANLGVEPRSLTKIISGGEISRFMLAFKSLQTCGQAKTCIFDEIDTGIGGEIGRVVGQKICEISRNNQVICITHLAQIASFGDHNLKIEKTEDSGSTITRVKPLDVEEKVYEIARMIGDSANDTAISHAKEIIAQANKFKVLN
ncbi:MAG: DNA repair protein RecN [Clostridiales bacterium]|nr:DNA repair protein RecN [Clostridiales bacterium]